MKKGNYPLRRLPGDLFSSPICYAVYGKGGGRFRVAGKAGSGQDRKLKLNLNSAQQTQFPPAGILLPDLLSCICGRAAERNKKEGRTDGKVTGSRN